MSGLEAIGAIAAVAQLATYGCNALASLQALRLELQSAPLRLQQRADYLENLIGAIDSIQQAPSAHPVFVERTLDSITVNSNAIRAQLSRFLRSLQAKSLKRYWKASVLRTQEQSILAAFTALERDKSNLVVYLTGDINKRLIAMDTAGLNDKMANTSAQRSRPIGQAPATASNAASNTQAQGTASSDHAPATASNAASNTQTQGTASSDHARRQSPEEGPDGDRYNSPSEDRTSETGNPNRQVPRRSYFQRPSRPSNEDHFDCSYSYKSSHNNAIFNLRGDSHLGDKFSRLQPGTHVSVESNFDGAQINCAKDTNFHYGTQFN